MGKERKSRQLPQNIEYKKITELIWEIPKDYKHGMLVAGRIYANKVLLSKMRKDRTLDQCANVAFLPGIHKFSITLPDGHEGYGFPIGGVAALDYENGVISPGGVGYDINCGVRLLRTNLQKQEIKEKLVQILDALFYLVPSGLGSKGRIRLTANEINKVAIEGAEWAISQEYGWKEDAERCEEMGRMAKADSNKISSTAKKRGASQLGSLGSGNHFLEIQAVEKIYNPRAAKLCGIENEGQVTVMIHTGSRGFGHQICSDYLRVMEHATKKYSIALPDRELACAPGTSREAQDYFAAMACAANFAWANRQMITHWTRQAFEKALKQPADKLEIQLIYDVAHNIAKIEEHTINKKNRKVYVHRKGATRSFPPNHPEIPDEYKAIGQPVIIPGSMGTASYLMIGSQKAMELTFGSTAHGAGRMLSRRAAKRQVWGRDVAKKLKEKGILVRAASMSVLAEENDAAYKNIDMVAGVSHDLGIATLVARLVPLGVTKG